ncbi:MAG: helix-turn-helix transcriptional regulator [Erysipelotrichia bacterium]|nr:helix-turn-helix transcriptional regulator [Erysipelotrichia bacterium]
MNDMLKEFKQNKLYTNAIVMMGIFTFIFLGIEYFLVTKISLWVDANTAVNTQNYALGASAVGYFIYAFIDKLRSEKSVFIYTTLSVMMIIIVGLNFSYIYTLIFGLLLFFLLGFLCNEVFYISRNLLSNNKYLACVIGLSYMLGIVLQFINNNFLMFPTIEGMVLILSLLCLVFLLNKNRNTVVTEYKTENKNDNNVKVILIILVVLMTCIFSTLDNAVTIIHYNGQINIEQWPRILLALSGLLSGFVFEIKDRKYMSLIIYCVMILSTICIVILQFDVSFLLGILVFYISAGFFAVFFNTAFMEIAYYENNKKLWSGMGRIINNIVAALISSFSVEILSSDNSSILLIIAILLLFVFTSVVTANYTNKRELLTAVKNSTNNIVTKEEKMTYISQKYSFTPREAEVFDKLVSTEENIQNIADDLGISRRTLERYISAIYEKTQLKSRVSLIRLFSEDKGEER